MSDSLDDNEHGTASGMLSAVLSVMILSAAIGIAVYTFFTEPTAERGGAAKKTAMLVDVIEVERGQFHPQIVAQGTVEPAKAITLRPEVSGRIVSLGDNFTPGGYVDEGEPLINIEPEDFRHTLVQRKSELEQAEADLAVAKGRRDAAEAEYDYLGDEKLSPKNKELLLQKPQLEAARSKVEAARAAVDQAELNLSRTTVTAPFDAHVLRRDVNVGSQVSPGDSLARLVGIDAYWVALELPLSKMRRVSVGGEDQEASSVQVRHQQAWPEDTHREGRLFKRVGAIGDETRMVRLLARIPDPLSREEAHAGKPELIIGEFVEATIRGERLENVVRLKRDHVRKNDTVWTMKEGELEINEVEIAVRDPEYAYISDGLEDGAKIVTTNLSTVVEGAALRLEKENESSEEGTNR